MENMKNDVDQLMLQLAPEIERKCEELKEARREQLKTRLFLLLCLLAVAVPTGLVFFGVSLALLLIPVVLMCLSVIFLLPILLKQQGGNSYEQA